MPVPDFQSLMLPVLRVLAAGADTAVSAVREQVATAEGLSADDLREMIPSGRQSLFVNRVSWAITYMERAGLLKRVRRGIYRLTQEGERLLSRTPSRIDMKLLKEYPGYGWERKKQVTSPDEEADPGRVILNTEAPGAGDDSKETPEEALDRAAKQLNRALEADVLDRVRSGSPMFFEHVVVDVLSALGYGGGEAAKARVTGRSGDGGIDGTIWEDALGLDQVHMQAKRYAEGRTVGESDLRNFSGALDAADTNKGVFVTTAGFTRAAEDFVVRSRKRIVLIDGEKLARLMVRHGVGVRTWERHEIKRIDEDYFDQEVT